MDARSISTILDQASPMQCLISSATLTQRHAGVDLVYMFMAVASIALRGIDTSGHKFFDNRMILSLNVFGAILDCITIGMVVKQHQKAIRVLAILHALLIIVIGPVSFIAIAIIRVLLISFLFRVRTPPSFLRLETSCPRHAPFSAHTLLPRLQCGCCSRSRLVCLAPLQRPHCSGTRAHLARLIPTQVSHMLSCNAARLCPRWQIQQ